MAYDLQAPAQILTPKYSPFGAYGPVITEVKIGLAGEGGAIKRFQYPSGNISYQVSMPCENAPHCSYCECATGHYVSLTGDQLTALRKLLEK